MKFISIISLLLLLTSNSIAQEGTNFEDLTFQEALAKAKQPGRNYSSTVTRKPVDHANTWSNLFSR